MFQTWQKINSICMMVLSKNFFNVSSLVYNLDWSQVIDLEIFFCFDLESISMKVANLSFRWYYGPFNSKLLRIMLHLMLL